MDPKAVRPRLRWIGVAWGLAVACIVAGVILSVSGLVNSVESVAPTKTFTAGERAVVSLDPADAPVVYLASDTRVHYQCQISGGPGRATLLPVSGTQNLTLEGTKWQQVLRINAPAAGDYQLTCITQEQADVRFGVGRDVTAAVGGVLGGVALLVLVPGVCVLAAIIVTIVVLVRRSSHRKRLAVRG
ncbi:hypothetical protein [Nonomuraea sp. LPB2021202275-12-8]|uniref:hypothetical protein n=1 Tax=Nonomuraea sp. LPB2021202275-12-8 TaxID=3120159 RepID=UPI00300C1AA6